MPAAARSLVPRPPRHTPAAAASSGGNGAAPPPAVREVLDRRQRQKLSAGDDREFYSVPRLVHHLDAGFRAQLTQLYRQRIPEGGDVLDLCSSWVSHLPPERKYGRVVGHGMNAAELGRNAQLRCASAAGCGPLTGLFQPAISHAALDLPAALLPQ